MHIIADKYSKDKMGDEIMYLNFVPILPSPELMPLIANCLCSPVKCYRPG